MQMIVNDAEGQRRKVLWWGGAGWPQPQGRFDLAYSLRASNFRGQREVQVEWVDFRPVADEGAEIRAARPELVDYRAEAHPRPLLERCRAADNTQVWAEAEAREPTNGLLRGQLSPAETLVIWTSPPGRAELQAAIERVQPKQIIVFGLEPASASLESFLQRLAGLVKYTFSSQNGSAEASLSHLAGACAQRESTTRKGLSWLETRGMLRILEQKGDLLRLEAGDGQVKAGAPAIQDQLRVLLDETSAYRRFFRSAPLEGLIAF
jgi:single-stranded-DNA-specific exonuclease